MRRLFLATLLLVLVAAVVGQNRTGNSAGSKIKHDEWRSNFSPSDQQRFNTYYASWLEYKRSANWTEARNMEARMREIMKQYAVPAEVPFERIFLSAQSQPEYRGDLRILNASWGNGFHVADVTARLQQMVRHDQLSVYVDNDSMGPDPDPGAAKTLTISYSFRGKPQSVSVKQGAGLTIP